MLPAIGGALGGVLLNQGYQFIKGQGENYAAANGPDLAWYGAKEVVQGVANGIFGYNAAADAVGLVAGEYVGAEAGALAANGLAVGLARDAFDIGQKGIDYYQGKKAEPQKQIQAVQEEGQAAKPEANESGYLDSAYDVAGWGAKRFARNWATVKIVDLARDTAFNGAMGAAKRVAGDVIGGTVGYVPAAMAGWKAGAWAAGGPAAVAATTAVDLLAPVAVNYAAPMIGNAAYYAGKGAYDYMFPADDQRLEKAVDAVKIKTEANGEIANKGIVQEVEDEVVAAKIAPEAQGEIQRAEIAQGAD